MFGPLTPAQARTRRAPGLVEVAAQAQPPAELRLDTVAFVGLCGDGGFERPTLVQSWDEFVRSFGGPGGGRQLPQSVNQFFANGGQRAVIVRVSEAEPVTRQRLVDGVELLRRWADPREEHPHAARPDELRPDELRPGELRPVAMVCVPDLVHLPAGPPPREQEDQPWVRDDLRFAEQCLPPQAERTEALARPWPELVLPPGDLSGLYRQIVSSAEALGALALLDVPPHLTSAELSELARSVVSGRAMLLAPWVLAPALERPDGPWRPGPPSGAVAGQIVWSERNRGVWRSPGNLPLVGVKAVYRDPYLPDGDLLASLQISAARQTAQGPRLMGAVTRADEREWRPVSTRRLMDWLIGQLSLDLRWAAFEPNEPRLWRRLEICAATRLSALYSAGALAGEQAADAYFVRCDAALNGQSARDSGRVVVEIGFAPAQPLELLMFRLTLNRDGAVEASHG